MFARYFARLDNVARLRQRIACDCLAIERRQRATAREDWARIGRERRDALRLELSAAVATA